jgi:hypothetical protein
MSFPQTAKKSKELITTFLHTPDVDFAPIAVNHGIYLSKKIGNSEMENKFTDLYSVVFPTDNHEIIIRNEEREKIYPITRHIEKLFFEDSNIRRIDEIDPSVMKEDESQESQGNLFKDSNSLRYANDYYSDSSSLNS